MTQCERLKNYLQSYNSITPLEAWSELGIYRLGARIFDLKREGLNIRSGMVGVMNKFGEKCNVAKYTLERV